MITITILALILILLALFSVVLISTVGAGAIILFGDIIVCGIFIWWIITKLIKNKKKD